MEQTINENIIDLDFQRYMREPKEFISNDNITIPELNAMQSLEAKGLETNTKYLIDLNRKRCTITRITFQQRVRTSIVLLRLDIDTKLHMNPDKKLIGPTHLHIYHENYGDTWAFELDDIENIKKLIPNYVPIKVVTGDFAETFKNFIQFCNFHNYPEIRYNSQLFPDC